MQYWLGQCQWVRDKRSINTFYSCGSQIKHTRENYSIPFLHIASIPHGFVSSVVVWPCVIFLPSKHEWLSLLGHSVTCISSLLVWHLCLLCSSQRSSQRSSRSLSGVTAVMTNEQEQWWNCRRFGMYSLLIFFFFSVHWIGEQNPG